MKNVVITHTYSLKNKGDFILLKGTIDIFRRLLGAETNFFVFSANPSEDSDMMAYPGTEFIHQIPFPVYNTKDFRRLVNSVASGILEYAASWLHVKSNRVIPMLFVSDEHRKTIRALIDADYVIGRSIDQISDIFGFATLLRNLYVIWFVKMLGKPFFLHSQTIYLSERGLIGKIARELLKLSLKNVNTSVRDTVSFNYLAEIGVHAPFIPAPSYFPISQLLAKFTKNDRAKYVLVIPRISLSRQDSDDKQNAYCKLIESIVANYNLDVLLMGQASAKTVDDDYELIEKILANLSPLARAKTSLQNIDGLRIEEFCRTIYNSKLTISERFISCMIALSMSVPCISIDPYNGKNKGIFMAYDLGDLCLPDTAAPEQIVSRVDYVFNNYSAIVEQLDKKNKAYLIDCVDKTEQWLCSSA
ncbi:MAG: polysaccharide pyruvyl transferase family protein [Nitrososphaera sp.]